jgi:hypothetical protein
MGMEAKVGDRILVDSEHVGTPPREGQILEVISGEVSPRFRVRWADGHETLFSPGSGAARVVPKVSSRTAGSRRSSR